MPVLQGWRPDDYVRCFDLMQVLPLPDLLGIGSVCRRHLGGVDGLMSIVAHLDRALPRQHKLHLFGVKGAAIGELAGHPRVHSVDSMAWDAAARRSKTGSCTIEHRSAHLRSWYAAQCARLNPRQARMPL
jgi:hypothetical protein